MNREQIHSLFESVPDMAESPHGETTRLAIINRLMSALPGYVAGNNHIYATREGSFRQHFFPDPHPGSRYAGIDAATGLDETFWSGFAVALLCAAIKQMSYETAKEIDRQAVDRTIEASNTKLREPIRLFKLYALVLSAEWKPLSELIAQPGFDRESARGSYLSLLRDDEWLKARKAALEVGDWANYDWILFHHWVKLDALGADKDQIDSVAADVARALPLPTSVAAGAWGRYFQWMRPTSDPARVGEISHAEFDTVASRGVLTTRVRMSIGNSRSPPTPYQIPEGYSQAFIEPGQPGHAYRVPTANSCFGAGAAVLMADGSHRAIENVTPGMAVATPSGPGRVAVLVRTPRDGRPLYRINGGEITFTAAHPFLAALAGPGEAAGDPPRFFAVSPGTLGQTIPTLSWYGVDRLQPGARLRGWSSEGPVPITVRSLDSLEAPEAEPEMVYDLVVWPREGSDFQYIVADRTASWVVAAEIPLIRSAPLATGVVLTVLLALEPHLRDAFGGCDRHAFEERFAEVLRRAVACELPAALRGLGSSPEPAATIAASSQPTLDTAFSRLSAAEGYNWMLGLAFAMAVQALGPSIESAIALGYRRLCGEPELSGEPPTLALSLFDVAFSKLARPDAAEAVAVRVALDCAVFDRPLVPERADPLPFLRRLDAVTYGECASLAPVGDIIHLRFEVLVGGAPRLFGGALVQWAADQPLRRYSARLADARGQPAGLLSFDVRPLSALARRAEEAERSRWDPPHMRDFAARLGPALAEELIPLVGQLDEPQP